MAEGVTTKDFINVIQSLESRREDEAAKRSRQEEIRSGKEETQLNKIAEQLKSASGTQKKSLEAQQIQIRLDQEERRREGIQLSKEAQFIKDQKEAQAEIAKRIEANGGKAEENLDFLKRNNKIQIQELELRKQEASPSQRKEINKDLRKAQVEGLKLAFAPVTSLLSPVVGFINQGLGKIVPGFTFGRLAGFVAIVALIKFLRSQMFIDLIDKLKEFDISKVGDRIGGAIDALQNGLIATGVVIAGMAARLIGAAGVGKANVKTKLTAKGIGIKADEVITDKSGRTFKMTAGGDLREFVKDASKPGGQRFLPPPKGGQDKLLRSLASEGALGNRGSLVLGRSGSVFRSITGILKRVPILSRIFAISDLISILGDDSIGAGEKTIQLTGLLGGLGGGLLGSIIGGLLGTALIPVPGLGSFVGSLGGGLIGYFLGQATVEDLARGVAQFATGLTVDAFPPFDFLGMTVDFNKILNGGRGDQPRSGQVASGGTETVSAAATAGVTTATEGSIMSDLDLPVFNRFSFAGRTQFLGAPTAPGIMGAFNPELDRGVQRLGGKGNVVIMEAESVNMSGTMLDKFANAFREFLEFGSRNVVVNNTTVRGGDQSMQGGRITANVLSNPDPVIQGITRQALF